MSGPSRREWILGASAAALLAAAAAYFAFRPDGYFPMVEARLDPDKVAQSAALGTPSAGDTELAGSDEAPAEAAETPGSPSAESAPADALPGAETEDDVPAASPALGSAERGLPGLPGSGAGMGSPAGGAERSGGRQEGAAAGKDPASGAGSGRKLSPIRHGPPSQAARDARAAEESDPAIANIGRILAGAGILQGPGGSSPFLQSSLRGGKGGLRFDPRKVAAAGGRTGQGQLSMEKNSVVTP
ncbi:MAG: hypothetical protein AAB339_09795, partial [Elusimicrobiota bacterium]